MTSENKAVDLSVIIPIYNEESNIVELHKRLKAVLGSIGRSFEIVFVDDGSSDQSNKILQRLYQENPGTIKIVTFARNFGHQLALSAGFNYCTGKAAVVLDADLQDPPEVIADFVKKWDEGFEVVYGVREKREGETWFKLWSASLFYKIIRATTNIDIADNVGDFYLLDRKVLDVLNSMKERHRFIRGLIAWVGYQRAAVGYVRKARHAGETKYPIWKMVKFSLDAMTSFSFTPLRVVSGLGAFFACVSFLYVVIIIYQRLFTDTTIVGWSSLMAVILFIGGVQLLAIGIIGEYIARIGDDVKSRPLYTVGHYLS